MTTSTQVDAGTLELMSILGHELRRPLTVIRGAATLLLQAHMDMAPESSARMLSLIDTHTLSMSDLIEDLLTVCHLDSGDVVLNLEDFDVAELVADVVETERRRSPQRPIVVLGSAPGLTVHADPTHASQVLRALVSNACRFSTPQSAVEVSGRAARRSVALQLTVIVHGKCSGIRREVVFKSHQSGTALVGRRKLPVHAADAVIAGPDHEGTAVDGADLER